MMHTIRRSNIDNYFVSIYFFVEDMPYITSDFKSYCVQTSYNVLKHFCDGDFFAVYFSQFESKQISIRNLPLPQVQILYLRIFCTQVYLYVYILSESLMNIHY